MTHDLLRNLIRNLNAELQRIVITDLKENTFFATLCLTQNGEQVMIDARPSDAIALALRYDCPIYVNEHVMHAARLQPPPAPAKAYPATNSAAGSKA